MDFRQIKQFVVLATELNYRKAAERLHMTQPPLSIAIKRLETGNRRRAVRARPPGRAADGRGHRLPG